MAKYKVGDKVRVKDHPVDVEAGWVIDMDKMLGEIVTIREVTSEGLYRIEDSYYTWCDEMFEDLVQTTGNEIIDLLMKKLGVEIDEEFEIIGSIYNPYKITEKIILGQDEKGKDVVIVPNNIRDIVEGDIIFVNLGIGYAHEIMKPHWCYVLKDCKSKFVVIPIHTVRGVICDEHEIDIQTVIEGSITTSRMSLSDIRSIDKQRIDQRRSVGKVLTPRSEILESIRKYFNL